MDPKHIQDTIMGIEVIYKATIELYEAYFKTLATAIENTPLDQEERLRELNELVQEAEIALQDDMALFERVAAMDLEDVQGLSDELKIQTIYNKLHK